MNIPIINQSVTDSIRRTVRDSLNDLERLIISNVLFSKVGRRPYRKKPKKTPIHDLIVILISKLNC